MFFGKKKENRKIVLMTFVGMIGKIQAMAYGIAKQWGDKFAVNELVNEAWIGSLRSSHTDAPLIMRAAQCDMMDYIRTHTGRKSRYEGLYDKRYNRMVKKMTPQLITNVDARHDDKYEHRNWNSFFDSEFFNGAACDKNLKKLENNELIELLLSTTTTVNATAMIHYYLEEKSLIETGEAMGKSSTHVCNILKKGRKRCKEVVDILELSFVKI